MKETRKNIIIRVNPDFHKVVKQIALNNDVTVQDYVKNLIIADALKKEPSKKEIIEHA